MWVALLRRAGSKRTGRAAGAGRSSERQGAAPRLRAAQDPLSGRVAELALRYAVLIVSPALCRSHTGTFDLGQRLECNPRVWGRGAPHTYRLLLTTNPITACYSSDSVFFLEFFFSCFFGFGPDAERLSAKSAFLYLSALQTDWKSVESGETVD